MSDNDPEILEKEKQKHLKGKTVSHIKEVPGWNEKLASDAEAVVKAEKECADCPIDEMQRQTVETLQKKQEEDAMDGSVQTPEPQSGRVNT